MGDGVSVPSGTTHVWDLPEDRTYLFATDAGAAVRLVALDRGGNVLSDVEMLAGRFAVPASTVRLVVQCLGKVPREQAQQPGFGAITSMFAAGGALPAVGWQSGNHCAQVGAIVMLARGASVRLGKHAAHNLRGQASSVTLNIASRAMLAQQGVETRLPSSVTVVMVLLDGQDATAATDGDLAIAVDGAKLITPPIPVGGGRRRALLYDLVKIDGSGAFFTVAAASRTGWQISGIAGLHGKAAEWAVRFHGNVPERIVPDGPLTPDGAVRIRATESSSSTTTPGGSVLTGARFCESDGRDI
jgi:hypothetical protein